jgi:hypothetical protein
MAGNVRTKLRKQYDALHMKKKNEMSQSLKEGVLAVCVLNQTKFSQWKTLLSLFPSATFPEGQPLPYPPCVETQHLYHHSLHQ